MCNISLVQTECHVLKLVENMPDLKYVKGIRYVNGVDDAKLDELSQKYGNIVFD